MNRRIAAIALALLAVLAVLVGCGGSSGSAKDAAQDYVDARNAGDSAKVCDLYTDQLKQRLGADKCAQFITEQTSGGTLKFELGSVEENGDKATATIQVSGNTELPQGGAQLKLSLAKQGSDWKIDGFGVGGQPSS